MNKNLYTLLFIFGTFISYGQFVFQKTFGGNNGDYGYTVINSGEGGFIIGGSQASSASGGGFLAKLNSSGDTLWTKAIFPTNSVQAIAKTDDHGFIISGQAGMGGASNQGFGIFKIDSSGTILWNTNIIRSGYINFSTSVLQAYDRNYIAAGTSQEFQFNSYDQFYVTKVDTSGNLLWAKVYQTSGLNYCNQIIQTHDSCFVLIGSSDYPSNSTNIIKINSTGNVIWAKNLSSPGNTFIGHSIQETNDQCFIITGWNFQNGLFVFNASLVKIDSTGTLLWGKSFGGNFNDYGLRIKQTPDNGFLITGYTGSFNLNNWDSYLIKTDSMGSLLWSKTYGGSGNEQCYDMDLSSDSGCIMIGFTSSFGLGYNDCYIIKTDFIGNSGGCFEFNPQTINDTINIMSNNLFIQVLNEGYQFPVGAFTSNFGDVSVACMGNVGVNDFFTETKNIIIYPNPSTGIFTFSSSYNFANAAIEIYDVHGDCIYSDNIINSNQKKICIDKMVDGIYFVKVSEEEKKYSRKIIIEKD